MNIFGIGPRLVIIGVVVFIIVHLLKAELGLAVSLSAPWKWIFQLIGIMLCVIGLWIWLSSIVLIKRAFKGHRLETSGAYRFSRNPVYAAFIVFIIPGIAFMKNNLLILFVSLCMFVCFKMLIRKEEEYLLQEFGDEFQQYSRKVAQLIPFVDL